jgi:hypothetical protein
VLKRSLDQEIITGLRRVFVVWMNPYRSVQMRVLLGQLEDIGKVRQVYGYA